MGLVGWENNGNWLRKRRNEGGAVTGKHKSWKKWEHVEIDTHSMLFMF